MKIRIKILERLFVTTGGRIIGCVFLIFLCLADQVVISQTYSPDIAAIRQKFKNFEYRAVIDSSRMLLQKSADLDTSETTELYRLSAVSYYSITRMDSALAAFVKIIGIDPAYELDPRENSPKILAFFQEVKQILAVKASVPEMRPEVRVDTLWMAQPVTGGMIASSMLLPGNAHRQLGQNTKGWILSGLAAASLASAVYFTVETNSREWDYLNAIDKAEIAARYDEYNQSHKLRNVAWTLFGLVWTYTQADLLFFLEPAVEHPPLTWSVAPECHPHGTSKLVLTICF